MSSHLFINEYTVLILGSEMACLSNLMNNLLYEKL